MSAIKQPCARDCPGRTHDCHGKCEKYAAYKRKTEEHRKLRRKEQEIMNAYCDGMKRRTGYSPMR